MVVWTKWPWLNSMQHRSARCCVRSLCHRFSVRVVWVNGSPSPRPAWSRSECSVDEMAMAGHTLREPESARCTISFYQFSILLTLRSGLPQATVIRLRHQRGRAVRCVSDRFRSFVVSNSGTLPWQAPPVAVVATRRQVRCRCRKRLPFQALCSTRFLSFGPRLWTGDGSDMSWIRVFCAPCPNGERQS